MTPITLTPATGDGVTTVFTAASYVVNELLLQDRLPQIPTTDYTVATSGGVSVYTFGTAPVLGAILTLFGIAPGTPLGSGTGTTTLVAIRTAAADRADMPTPTTTTFITTATWNNYINASYQELFDLLIQKYGNDYYVALDSGKAPFQITTDGTSEMFGLPDGTSTYKMPDTTSTAPAFYKGLGVDLQISGAQSWVTLKTFPMIERNTFAVPNMQAVRGRRTNLRYRFTGNISGNAPTQFLWLKPLPQGGQTVRVWYIPRLTALVNDSDTVDAVSGWEEYVIVDAARKAAIKEESFELAGRLDGDKAALVARIEAASESRDAGSPMIVGDARRANGWGDDVGWDEEWG